jgi:beta-glucosidase-like glycosyl hydrolase
VSLDVPLLVPALRLDRDAAAEAKRALAWAREPWLAGYLLFGGEAGQVARLTQDLRHEAGRPIFVASDMERGAGQQVRGLTRLPDAGILGLAGTARDAVAFGAITAREARSVGVDVVFAPCLDVRSEPDNPILGTRSLGFDPWRVADLGCAFVRGVLRGGALPVAKHFPGHGATREDSHDALPVVRAGLRTLEARDLPPFRKAIRGAGCPAVMTAHVAYPTLDPSGCVATFSKAILDRARSFVDDGREGAGLLVFTDALLMAGAAVAGGEAEAARRALAAGCDLLLYPQDPEALAAALDAEPADVERALANRERFLAEGRVRAVGEEAPPPGDGDPAASPDAVARRAVALARPATAAARADALVLIDDDDVEERGAVLARRAAGRGLPVTWLRVPRGDGLGGGVDGAAPGAQVVLVVFASARAWKGAPGASEPCRRLVGEARAGVLAAGAVPSVIWCAPRPEDDRDAHVPGTGPQVEAALGRLLLGHDPRRGPGAPADVPDDA